jgi:hypothetical protein
MTIVTSVMKIFKGSKKMGKWKIILLAIKIKIKIWDVYKYNKIYYVREELELNCVFNVNGIMKNRDDV